MSNRRSATPPGSNGDKPRVLLVDDNGEMLELAAAALSLSCAIVGKASNGCEAIAAVRSCRPDVVVLDISMPGMSGFEVAQQLRAAGSPPAIVFLSVYED